VILALPTDDGYCVVVLVGNHTASRRISPRTPKVELQFGSTAKPRDFEMLANHTRRMMHHMYAQVTQDFYGVTPKLATTNPHEVNRQMGTARAEGKLTR
jgi:hypothetical protein